jgi:hypothetical protein
VQATASRRRRCTRRQGAGMRSLFRPSSSSVLTSIT